ncbi:polyphosphate kinase 2 family protein [Chryseolinea sp. H1M3-3]|uniref:polyphosphate kinase 2 family protein n=1 Tax=Chryseolinea sp. H1M3-3 TaxID=3034144 RepID=UPI0023EB278D|nr:polyphosphate kinase 2 family protein [Chryseolinea sp. H1M3-3]
MLSENDFVAIEKFKVKPGKVIRLKDFPTGYEGKSLNKSEAGDLLESGLAHLSEVQDKLYAQNQYSVLIILQAMDASGKDSAVKHIMSGFNPLGVKVYSFKAPTPQELDHHYLWRHIVALPGRGEIAIHNRSHYENVLVTRVHPEYIMKEQLPGIDTVAKIDEKFWDSRFKQINRFEENISENGTIILKFFLNLSKDEQKKRFLERIDDPEKHWKFAFGDLLERAHWDEYQFAYEEAINATSTKYAPWYIIPADDKWYTRLAIAGVIYKQFKALAIDYPKITDAQRAELMKGREMLMNER